MVWLVVLCACADASGAAVFGSSVCCLVESWLSLARCTNDGPALKLSSHTGKVLGPTSIIVGPLEAVVRVWSVRRFEMSA